MDLPTFIQSAANPFLKDIRRALAQGEPTKEGWIVADSLHLAEEAVRSRRRVRALLMATRKQAQVEARLGSVPIDRRYLVSDGVMERMVSTESSQGVIALVEAPSWTMDDVFPPGALVLVLDAIQDPGNCGAIFRCAEAFGASGLLLGTGTAQPFSPKCLRASAGSAFRVPFVPAGPPAEVRQALETRGAVRLAATPRQAGSVAPHQVDFRAACAILIGSEGRGLAAELAAGAQAVSIPTRGVESLNAAVSAAILLYEAARQRNARE